MQVMEMLRRAGFPCHGCGRLLVRPRGAETWCPCGAFIKARHETALEDRIKEGSDELICGVYEAMGWHFPRHPMQPRMKPCPWSKCVWKI